jgi:hypothetical protein
MLQHVPLVRIHTAKFFTYNSKIVLMQSNGEELTCGLLVKIHAMLAPVQLLVKW